MTVNSNDSASLMQQDNVQDEVPQKAILTRVLGQTSIEKEMKEDREGFLDAAADQNSIAVRTKKEEKSADGVITRHFDRVCIFLSKYLDFEDYYSAHIFQIAKEPLKWGMYGIVLFFVVFGGFAALVPLDGAIVIGGTLVPANNRRMIQHPDGGVIEQVFVEEGQKVQKGDMLVKLRDVKQKSDFETVKKSLFNFKLNQAILIAQRDNVDKLILPDDLLAEAVGNESIQASIQSHSTMFKNRQLLYKGSLDMLEKKRVQLRKDLESVEAGLVSLSEHAKMAESAMGKAQKLLDLGHISNPQFEAKKSNYLNTKASLEEAQIRKSKFTESLASSELELISIQNKHEEDIEGQLSKTNNEISKYEDHILAVKDALDKTGIISNLAGIVTNLSVKNKGEIVGIGVPIMEIVPANEPLVIDARLSTNDIQALMKPGIDLLNYKNVPPDQRLKVKVRFSAYSARRFPMVKGYITSVAADTKIDQARGFMYYPIRVEIPHEEISKVKDLKLYPGMTAETYILTTPRTVLSYMLYPITSLIGKSFIEGT